MPSVSIMITTKDRAADLCRTLSVLRQLNPAPLEILITADECPDNTVEMLKAETLRGEIKNLKVIINETGKGSVASRDRMMREARSDLVLPPREGIHLPNSLNILIGSVSSGNPFQRQLGDALAKDPTISSIKYGDVAFWKNPMHCNVLHIHWPEGLFNWKEPARFDIAEMLEKLRAWKPFARIVVTVHNRVPHYRDTDVFRNLYRDVYKSGGWNNSSRKSIGGRICTRLS